MLFSLFIVSMCLEIEYCLVKWSFPWRASKNWNFTSCPKTCYFFTASIWNGYNKAKKGLPNITFEVMFFTNIKVVFKAYSIIIPVGKIPMKGFLVLYISLLFLIFWNKIGFKSSMRIPIAMILNYRGIFWKLQIYGLI